ncbi:helix-turn-helix domain-containing protein [Amycolatopsis sp. NPDC023774]|uniref:TetR/AcrR family transcriptional regulator n=1 Tax=Amycolatopsis sp. NPDC023774 TaxID=3155015 RepID=UPI0033D3D39D
MPPPDAGSTVPVRDLRDAAHRAPGRRRADRQKLLEAALAEFSRRPYAEVTVGDIARTAGVAHGWCRTTSRASRARTSPPWPRSTSSCAKRRKPSSRRQCPTGSGPAFAGSSPSSPRTPTGR